MFGNYFHYGRLTKNSETFPACDKSRKLHELQKTTLTNWRLAATFRGTHGPIWNENNLRISLKTRKVSDGFFPIRFYGANLKKNEGKWCLLGVSQGR